METLRFAQDEDGQLARVYVKHAVLDPHELVELQEHLLGATFECTIPADSLHMTLFHFGKPESLYSEILQENPGLDWDTFIELFSILMLIALEQEKRPIRVRGDVLSVFEDKGMFYVVLKLYKTDELMKLRQPVLVAIHSFLSACGVNKTEVFMRKSENLRYQLNYPYTPHITLGINSHAVNLPDIDVSDIVVSLGEQEIVSVYTE